MLAASYARLGQREEAREALQLSPAHWGIYAGGGFLVGALLYTKMIELIA